MPITHAHSLHDMQQTCSIDPRKATVYISYLECAPCNMRSMCSIPVMLQGGYLMYEIHTLVFTVWGGGGGGSEPPSALEFINSYCRLALTVLSTQTTKPQSTCSCYSTWIETLGWQNGSACQQRRRRQVTLFFSSCVHF